MAAKRVTAREARGGQNRPAKDTESLYRFRCVIRTGRQIAAGSGKHRRNKDFVHAYQCQREALRDGELTVRLSRTAGLSHV
jgi:hypothetical protein